MIFAIDTNILLDILIPNSKYLESSLSIITDVSPNKEVLFEASCAWKNYLRYKINKLICPHCGKSQDITCNSCNRMIIARAHILSDFLIGSHAKILADKLISRDRGFYRAYFKTSKLLIQYQEINTNN